ncbi:arylesterase [Flexibacterium corallicola]|uniref:arylesterase n=1 Tax=Flexibacterium corallicola TaxID=3037259 RepID=UPI00286F844B|nr:arylesterase [Pseudovibrio sp. M1P-2-3]
MKCRTAVLLVLLYLGSTIQTYAEEALKIAAFGDSLSAGYLLDAQDSFSAQLQNALREKGHLVTVVNAAVSGDTTSSGLARLDWSIGEDVDIVILELGANDALRGVEPQITRSNLQKMLNRLLERDILVLLAGMMAPPNLGEDYGSQFNRIYPELAEKYQVALFPFFLEGVAARPSLNLADGIHPTPEGVSVIVENILPSVEKLMSSTKSNQ